jgi:hypothetical protein
LPSALRAIIAENTSGLARNRWAGSDHCYVRKGDTLHADFGSLGGIAVQFV